MLQVDQFLVLLYLEIEWPLLASDDSITQSESTGLPIMHAEMLKTNIINNVDS
jgi:hypothetical protein